MPFAGRFFRLRDSLATNLLVDWVGVTSDTVLLDHASGLNLKGTQITWACEGSVFHGRRSCWMHLMFVRQ